MKKLIFGFLAVAFSFNAFGQSVGSTAADNSVKAQLASFRVHSDFEVSLFADESMGIANPIAMEWDNRGRLWVLTTLTYAQLEPGESPNDTLVILEDTDNDGRADESRVFADGLEMPMGFALHEDGVFLGEGPDLLLLRDTDGDDKVDIREVVLTGFGTGDTHQNISNFTWGPDEKLYFAQGLHCYSRVETPYGIVRGDTAGFWRFDPETLRLEPFCFPSMASQNPCGMIFDRTGALFIKSNNRELFYATPGLIPTTHEKNLVPITSIGATPGKSMGGEYVDSAALPSWIQNHILIAGYYAHRVSAFPLVKDGAGYAEVEPVEVLVSDHVSFRPVEIRIGPDGAIYVADWFNPIIGHYQASLRHPDRDEKHGRVWRVAAKDTANQPDGEDKLTEVESEDVSYWPEKLNFDDPSWASSDEPRARLADILAAANSGQANALPAALRALDHPRDRFLDYALEQTVHALAAKWVPAVETGEIAFGSPGHLAFALETLGGEDALRIARKKYSDADLTGEAHAQIARVLAKAGNAQDIDRLMQSHDDPTILAALVSGTEGRRVRPTDPDTAAILQGILTEGQAEEQLGAAVLAGRWKIAKAADALRKIISNPESSDSLRAASARSLGDIDGADATEDLVAAWQSSKGELAGEFLAALVTVNPDKASNVAALQATKVSSMEEAAMLLSPFVSREGGIDGLLAALRKQDLSKEAAGHLASATGTLGGGNEKLLGFLQDAMGIQSGARVYSPDFVADLVSEVAESGNADAGAEIYARAQLTCVACHQMDGAGGIIGPPLDAVGAGLSPDLLIESILWPQRQMKEGYFAVTVTTKSGDSFSGYREKEEAGTFHLRDTATGQVRELPRVEISRIEQVGSLMPPGLTNSLTREELRDLVAYLASRKG